MYLDGFSGKQWLFYPDYIVKLTNGEIWIIETKELFGLIGGGIRINGEYVPVELTKVHEAILAQDYEITER